jgi:hypothetical protein
VPELKTKVVEYGPYRITVRESTALEEARRERLAAGCFNEKDADRAVAQLMYADLCGATVAAEGLEWPVTFEDYLTLPGELIGLWKAAVMEVNPYWFGVQKNSADEEKKQATPSTSGS